MIALYAACILAPHAAMAFSAASAHCLIEAPRLAHVHNAKTSHGHEHDTSAHEHHDHAVHSHLAAEHDHGSPDHAVPTASDDRAPVAPASHDDGDAKHGGGCCGIFCISAIAAGIESIIIPQPIVSAAPAPFETAPLGRAPSRIHRPPIV
jgi:hypothetical protein